MSSCVKALCVTTTTDTYRGKNEKIGDVCLFVYMFGRTYVILYFVKGLPFLFQLVAVVSQCALCHGYKPCATVFT